MRVLPAATLALLLLGGALAASPPHGPSRANPSTNREVLSFVKLVNQYRKSRGLPALIWDERVADVARAKCRDMFERDNLSHTWSDGGKTWDRLTARHLRFSAAGENIAWGQPTGRAVLRSWLHSQGHRENIENAEFTHHGVAKVGPYWTHIFVRLRRGR